MSVTTYPLTLDGLNGIRAVVGLPPLTPAENAAKAARSARLEYLIATEKREFTAAHKERDLINLSGWQDGESYQQFRARLNAPLSAAAERVAEAMVAYDAALARKVAA